MNIEKLWSAACSGDLDVLKNYYENGGETNLRYAAFNQEHSLIAGAYRNNQTEVVKYLFSVGETVGRHEQGEAGSYNNSHGLTLSQIAEMINELGDDQFLEMFMELAHMNIGAENEVCDESLIDAFTEWLNTVLHEINDKEE